MKHIGPGPVAAIVPNWLEALARIEAVVVGVLIGLVVLARKAWPLLSGGKDFLDDWRGEAARPGVEARPGIPDRLAALEKTAAETNWNTKPNHGTSPHDDQNRLIEATRAEAQKTNEQLARVLIAQSFLMQELVHNHPQTQVPPELDS